MKDQSVLAKKERCRHEQHSWIIASGLVQWCFVCGAFRRMRIVGPSEIANNGPWHRPSGDKNVNPWDSKADDRWKKMMEKRREK